VNSDRSRPVALLSRVVVLALLLTVVLDVVSIVSGLSYHDLIGRIESSDPVAVFQAQGADNRENAIGWAQLILFASTAIVFITWFHRVYANLPRLGVSDARWRARWAIVGWFVPFLNLVRPKAIANDIWRGSNPDPSVDSATMIVDVPWYHTAWWAAFLVAGFAERITFREELNATTLSALDHATLANVTTDCLEIVAACLAAVVVYQTTLRQLARAQALRLISPADHLADRLD
jgi:hypothetical protein